MICQPCIDKNHHDCEDQVRQDKFVEWLRTTYEGPDFGPEESRVIKANRPYPSCSCQHKVKPDAKTFRIWTCCGLPYPGPHLDGCPHA